MFASQKSDNIGRKFWGWMFGGAWNLEKQGRKFAEKISLRIRPHKISSTNKKGSRWYFWRGVIWMFKCWKEIFPRMHPKKCTYARTTNASRRLWNTCVDNPRPGYREENAPKPQKGQTYQPDIRLSPTSGDRKNTSKIPEKSTPKIRFSRILGVFFWEYLKGFSGNLTFCMLGGILACRGLSYSVAGRWVLNACVVSEHFSQEIWVLPGQSHRNRVRWRLPIADWEPTTQIICFTCSLLCAFFCRPAQWDLALKRWRGFCSKFSVVSASQETKHEKPSKFREHIHSVQIRCIVKGEAQKSPLFWRFSRGCWFSQDRLFSRNSTRKPLNLIKSPIFTNAPCKTTCLYNAPSMHTVEHILV